MPVPFLAASGSGRHAAAAALENALGQTPDRNTNDAWLANPLPTRAHTFGKFGRIALRYCTGAVFFPSAISCSTLRVGCNHSEDSAPPPQPDDGPPAVPQR